MSSGDRDKASSDVYIKQEQQCEEENNEAAIQVKAEPENGEMWVKIEPESLEVLVELKVEYDESSGVEGEATAEEKDQRTPDLDQGCMKQELVIETPLPQTSKEVTEAHEPKICHRCTQIGILPSPSKDENCKKTSTRNITHKAVKCNTCDKKLCSNSALNRHQRIHTGEKPYSCDICNKKFPKRETLNIHLRVHSGEQPFACDICNRKFSQKTNLIRHLLVHSGEQPFMCELCDKKFSMKCNLTIHMRGVHRGEKPFKCHICENRYKHKGHLRTHLRVTHRTDLVESISQAT